MPAAPSAQDVRLPECAKEASGSNTAPPRIFRFGPFELKTETRELSRQGIRVKLQVKPLQILVALLERPGQLVTREELSSRLWPTGTFVDFESGLNTATNRLRAALCDSAEAPRYIETIPRLGYRLICPVTEVEDSRPQPLHSADRAAVTPAVRLAPALSAPRKITAAALRWPLAALVGIALLAAALGSVLSAVPRPDPAFRLLTFRTGNIVSAHFTPDSQEVVYTAKWLSGDRETYSVNLNNSASGSSSLASALTPVSNHPDTRPDPALVRNKGAESFVEFPAGHIVYKCTSGWISNLRVSPRAEYIAFLEHPFRDDDSGHVRLVSRTGDTRLLTAEWSSAEGLAWSPTSKEVWFTASPHGAMRALYGVSLSGFVRKLSNTPSSLRLLDISPTGRVLLAIDEDRIKMTAALPEDPSERDISLLDSSHVDAISRDGSILLFTEGGDGGGEHYASYVRNERAHTTSRLADGRGLALSPSGSLALLIDPLHRTALTVTTVATGESRTISGAGLQYQWAKFFPDAQRILAGASYPGQPLRLYTQSITGAPPALLEGVPYFYEAVFSRDASHLLGFTPTRDLLLVDLASKAAHPVLAGSHFFPLAWSHEANAVYGLNYLPGRYQILKGDLQTGEVQPLKAVTPEIAPGFTGLAGFVMAPDSAACVYSTHLRLSRLYLVDGWS
jgi:DNA-binding winged helix-turn-helix (wHTH) protein